jgi:putative nucleotidyltransferase with HDIG domain
VLFSIKKNKRTNSKAKNYFKSETFQRLLISILTILTAFIIVGNGALPKKYDLRVGDKSHYDISAPRDIENTIKTEEKALTAAEAVPSVMKRMENVPIDVLNEVDDFVTSIDYARKSVEKSLLDQGITRNNRNYNQRLEVEQAIAAQKLSDNMSELGMHLTDEQVKYLIEVDEQVLAGFKKISRELISKIMKEEITERNLANVIYSVQSDFQETSLSQELKNIGGFLVKTVLRPNCVIDLAATTAKRGEAYRNAKENKEIISKDSRILSVGDIVTEDKYQVLMDLNLIETGKPDITFAAGIFVVLLLLASLLILYMHFFCKNILTSRSDVILISVVVLLTLLISRVVNVYSPLLIPIFIAPMLISILLDLKLAILINFILAAAISFIIKGDTTFLYMAMISGTFSAFLVFKANQRSRLSASGLILACINVLVVVCMGIINKGGIRTIVNEGLIACINGIVSTVFTIGVLPFFEGTFNIITPFKLLELTNPNQPLIKKLLIEAPGTYHHSLMVGNLAEVATEAIDGNALLARVGAYYHDIGKLKRPNFFSENQLSDNPHDRMTPSLSTLVITSHARDGVEMAEKYKIPLAIRDIIRQHHGTTMVVYFYHKAKKHDDGDAVKEEDFRYEGPKPSTKEAAVVMLADSVEAAVRSMSDKTEGKIEGFVRKIIKDKLDDGQFDQCGLTLKDLDDIAKAFMRVFSGYFHAREEYPDIKVRNVANDKIVAVEHDNKNILEQKRAVENGGKCHEN